MGKDESHMKEECTVSMKEIAGRLHGPFIHVRNLLVVDGRLTAVHTYTHKEGHMKHNRIIALVAGVLVSLGAMAAIVPRAYAQSPSSSSAQLQSNSVEQADDQGGERESIGVDMDREQVQSGDQSESERGWDGREGGDRRDPFPQAKPAITASAAIAAAQTYLKNDTSVRKLVLEDENGKLVYSVWIAGTDVKVDAVTGSVLGTDSSSY
jgi:uncharacterized membrane protein YkoI